MTKLEQEQFEKQVYENQETAIKLLQENILLKYETVSFKKTIEEQQNKIEELKSRIQQLEEEYYDLEKSIEDNYVPRFKDKYEEYGISEKDFY